MKRFILVIFAACLVIGCKTPSSPDTVDTDTVTQTVTPSTPDSPAVTPATPATVTKPVFVRDVEWKVLYSYDLVSARSIESTDGVKEMVEEHNAGTTVDPWYLDTENTPIENAPKCHIQTVYTDNGEKLVDELVDRVNAAYEVAWQLRWLQEQSTHDQRPMAVYVDSDVPTFTAAPVVPVIDPRTPYEKYSFYILNDSGIPIFVEHITEENGYTVDGVVQTNFCDSRMATLLANWRSEFPDAAGCVSGKIYTDPDGKVW